MVPREVAQRRSDVRVDVGSIEELQEAGYLTAKAGSQPVCVFWHDGCAYGIDDRCPHLGFPLHRGTVESGMVTCHWHHARFDLESGGTLDPWADDVRAYPVEIEHGRVVLDAEPRPFDRDHAFRRLDEGLEQGLTLVLAKTVLATLDAGVPAPDIVGAAARFGCAYREQGFGSGLTVLCAMANVLGQLEERDRPLALVQGLSFLSENTRGNPPRFPLDPLQTDGLPKERLVAWYRRFIETRSGDAAERTLVSAVRSGWEAPELAAMMGAAITDHVFLDEGHTLDFTNKAFELVEHLGPDAAAVVLPTLAQGTAHATRHEEEGAWRHPHDLASLATEASVRLETALAAARWDGGEREPGESAAFETAGGPSKLAWDLLGEDPTSIVEAIFAAISAGASGEQLARAVAFAASLRVTRFHVQNDHADWDVVHHGFTAANALHQMIVRAPSPLLLRGVVQVAMKVFLDRFLNVPAARLPKASSGDLAELGACFDTEGRVDEAGSIVYGYLRGGGSRAAAIRALGSALLREDAGFHWFQTYEAAVRQSLAWPEGSEESALVLVGAARFLAAHTPTRRELAQVVSIAGRLRRGEALYEEEDAAAGEAG
jgi:nitrite reductase/ring-hydroxylating ferredoxin subunit